MIAFVKYKLKKIYFLLCNMIYYLFIYDLLSTAQEIHLWQCLVYKAQNEA